MGDKNFFAGLTLIALSTYGAYALGGWVAAIVWASIVLISAATTS